MSGVVLRVVPKLVMRNSAELKTQFNHSQTPAKDEPNTAKSSPNAALVREQLKRVLAHQLFTNSRRYPVLLAYVVEQALLGNASALKERTIGAEAFGREPDYDVNLDPVVRTTAAEVRKKLTQYYYSPDHAGELVIELPIGSYIPSFREPIPAQPGSASEPVLPQQNGGSPRDPAAPRDAPAEPEHRHSKLTVRHWTSIAIALVSVAIMAFGLGRVRFPSQSTSLERFWEPITATSRMVTYCIGEPAHGIGRGNFPPEGARLHGDLDVSDVTTLARSIFPLVPRNRAFRVVAASNTGFTQLREGPFILIGAYDNIWTMRITQDLPFGFEYDANSRRIVDRKSAQGRAWTIQLPGPNANLDYAIVARIHDKVTGQPVIVLAGILRAGTEAAGEVVSNSSHLDALLQKAPKNWDQLNLEAVIKTQVIDDHPGPPTVVAVETW